jgi:hypothetical protein
VPAAQVKSGPVLVQARANFFQVGGGCTLGGWIGAHPLSCSDNGAMVTDWTHGTPPQSFPEGIGFAAVQVPSHLTGGSNEVCGTPGAPPAQVAADAVKVVGNPHDPIGGAHAQASQCVGASRSPWPE